MACQPRNTTDCEIFVMKMIQKQERNLKTGNIQLLIYGIFPTWNEHPECNKQRAIGQKKALFGHLKGRVNAGFLYLHKTLLKDMIMIMATCGTWSLKNKKCVCVLGHPKKHHQRTVAHNSKSRELGFSKILAPTSYPILFGHIFSFVRRFALLIPWKWSVRMERRE